MQPDTLIPDLSNPQSWNRFSYVYNNPILHNDPTGHCPMCVTAAIGGILGAAIGAASVALPQMIKNAQAGQPLTTNIDPAEVGKAAAAGAVAGVIGGLTFGIGTAVMGSGLGATMVAGAVSGALAGQASRATNNVLSGRNVGTGLFSPKDMAVDAVVGGAMAGVGWGIGKYVSSLKGGCSFTKDTTVAIKDGKKAIGSIVIGDYVLAWNEADGTLDYYPVTAVLVHEDEVLTELVIDGEWIETTPEHPFYSEEEGWVSAYELKTGMHVRQADGDFELVWLKWNVYKTQEMYNLTVDTAHTFFVGEGQWLVHNDCRALANTAHDAHQQLPGPFKQSTVGAALDNNGNPLLSVYERTEEGTANAIRYLRNRGWNVLDAPAGRGSDFHAERQLFDLGYKEIGISRQGGICASCQKFFDARPNVTVLPYKPPY